jgi:hypothetical protein
MKMEQKLRRKPIKDKERRKRKEWNEGRVERGRKDG